MNSLLLSLSKFVNKTLDEMGLYQNFGFIQLQNKNCIQEFYLRHENGCSQTYNLLLRAYLRDNHIKPPPALATASVSYINFNFNPKNWQDSLKYVSKRIALPHSSTTILKIFYRQNWNPWKQGMRTGDQYDSFCKYCRENTIANSKHIFLDCPIAIQPLTFLNEMIQELLKCTQNLDPNIIFSLGIKAKSNSERCVVLDLSACILHFLHKIHFKDLMTPGQLENFLYKCIMRTIYANKLADRNVQHFKSVFYCVERLLKRSFVYDFLKKYLIP